MDKEDKKTEIEALKADKIKNKLLARSLKDLDFADKFKAKTANKSALEILQLPLSCDLRESVIGARERNSKMKERLS